MDALSRLLMLNAPQGTIDKNCVLGSDWQLPHGAGELSVIRWHALTQGAAKLEMPTGEIFTLRPGNVVLLPQNSAHRLSHVDNESTCIVCGTLRLQHSARYFLTSLPETLFVAPVNHSVEYNWLREAIPFLQQESRSAMPGVDALCSQICATFFTLAVREWIAQVNTEKNILSLLLHPRLGAVIQQMMEMPGHAWTVESLASIAHMSRASFAQLAEGLALCLGHGAHGTDISACNEALVAFASQDNAADGLLIDSLKSCLQVCQNLRVQGIQCLGTVDGDDLDSALHLGFYKSHCENLQFRFSVFQNSSRAPAESPV